jgi:hypothetical protein
MDAFTDSELFDDDASCAPLPQTDEASDSLTVSPDSVSLPLRVAGVLRRAVYVVAALAVLVAAALALRVGRPSPERNPRRGTARSHHARSRAPRPRQQIVTRRRAVTGRVPGPLVAAKVVVRVPNSSPERPSASEGVGIARPTNAPTVGNTEQFGYLGR